MSDAAPWEDYAAKPTASNDDAGPWNDFAPTKSAPQQTVSGAVQAAGSGLTSGIADVAGLPVDTARRVVEIGKAALGSAYGAATSKTATPEGETLTADGSATRTTHGLYHYIDPTTGADTFSKNPPPAGSRPITHTQVMIPTFLQPAEQADLGGSESLKSGIRSVLGNSAVDTQEQTPLNSALHAAGEAAPTAVLFPESGAAGALSAAAGGAASDIARQQGYGPVWQTLAGLAAGSAVPIAAANAGAITRTIAGGDSAATVAARNAAAAESGTTLTAGQATGSRTLQKLEGASGTLWGGGAIDAKAQAQTQDLQSKVGDIVDNLSGGTTPSPTAAGEAINSGAATTKANMRAQEKAAFDKRDALVPANHPTDVSGTLAKLDSLAATTPGAAATTGDLVSSKISTMRDNLRADLQANQASATPSTGLGSLGGAAPRPISSALPYSAVRQLRTAVGNSIDWGFAPSDPVTNGALKQVHGALSADLDRAASVVSPEARQAALDANKLYSTNQDQRDLLNGIIEKAGGPEAVYNSAINGTKQGATKISGVMDALDDGQKNIVRATVLDRLGRAVPSSQNATGSAFDAGTFLTNWAKLDPAAKDALFGSSGAPKTLRSSLDSIADTMSTLRESGNALKNSSGTAKAAGHGYGLWSLLGEASTAALTGHTKFAAGSVAAGAGITAGNAVLSRALVNPRTAAWLAQTAKLPPAALPNAVNQLAKMGQASGDPDARDLASYLQKNQ